MYFAKTFHVCHTLFSTSRFRIWQGKAVRMNSSWFPFTQGSCDSCDVPQRSCANNSKAEKADLVQARKSACKASEYVKDSPNLSEPATIEKLMTLPNDIWIICNNNNNSTCMSCDSCKFHHTDSDLTEFLSSVSTFTFKNSDLTARQAYIIGILIIGVQRDHAVHCFKIFQRNAINLCWASERESSLSCLQRKVWPLLQTKMTFSYLNSKSFSFNLNDPSLLRNHFYSQTWPLNLKPSHLGHLCLRSFKKQRHITAKNWVVYQIHIGTL